MYLIFFVQNIRRLVNNDADYSTSDFFLIHSRWPSNRSFKYFLVKNLLFVMHQADNIHFLQNSAKYPSTLVIGMASKASAYINSWTTCVQNFIFLHIDLNVF